MRRKVDNVFESEKRLKEITIEHFQNWKIKNPVARNQKYIVKKSPKLSEASLSRILKIEDKKCPSLEEAIEFFMITDGIEVFESYIKATNTTSAHYLRSLLKNKGPAETVDMPVINNDDVLIDINDKLEVSKNDRSTKGRILDVFIGLVLGFAFGVHTLLVSPYIDLKPF